MALSIIGIKVDSYDSLVRTKKPIWFISNKRTADFPGNPTGELAGRQLSPVRQKLGTCDGSVQLLPATEMLYSLTSCVEKE